MIKIQDYELTLSLAYFENGIPALVSLVLFGFGLFIILALLNIAPRVTKIVENWGLNTFSILDWPVWAKLGFFLLLGPILVILLVDALLALFGLSLMIFDFAASAWNPSEENSNSDETLRGAAFALGALVGFPFLAWRSWVAHRQYVTAEQGSITDRINKAVEQLGKDKVVIRSDKKGGKQEVTEPNIEVRIGALFALERISQDSERDHITVMEIICAYVRENTKTKSEIDRKATAEERDRFAKTYKISLSKFSKDQKNITQRFHPPREDIQTAINILGRRSKSRREFEQSKEPMFRIDLSDCNLDGIVLHKLNFDNARFENSSFHGARLPVCSFRNAGFYGSSLIGAMLSKTDFSKSSFWMANFSRASCVETVFSGAELRETNFEYVHIRDSFLNSVKFHKTQISETTFVQKSPMTGSLICNCYWKNAKFLDADYNQIKMGDVLLYDYGSAEASELPFGSGKPQILTKEMRFQNSGNHLHAWRAWQKKNGYTLD